TRVEKKGSLNFEDFLHFIQESEHQLMALFKYMDENRDGIIDADEIVSAFARFGVKIDKQEAYVLLKRMDKDNSQTISFNEWRDYLLFLPSFELHEVLRSWRHATFLDLGENVLVPEDFTKDEMHTGMWWRHLVAGGLAGAVSRTCTAPLDRIKVFLQVKGSEYNSIRSCLKHMLKEGGVKSLWRGNGINVMKIAPESALKFMAYEQAKRLIRGDSERELGIYERFVAGSLQVAFLKLQYTYGVSLHFFPQRSFGSSPLPMSSNDGSTPPATGSPPPAIASLLAILWVKTYSAAGTGYGSCLLVLSLGFSCPDSGTSSGCRDTFSFRLTSTGKSSDSLGM
ncbi:calcium-binding mitochondrial carrier protein SCaMC-2-A, partial [Trichonephila clavata]